MINNPQQPNQHQVQIKISDDVMKGFYANNMFASYTGEEFVMDFASMLAAPNQGIVGAKIITSPGHMKRIVNVLQANIKKYEDQYGEIKAADAPQTNTGLGFEDRK